MYILKSGTMVPTIHTKKKKHTQEIKPIHSTCTKQQQKKKKKTLM